MATCVACVACAALLAAGCGMTGQAVVVDVDPRGWTQAAELAVENDDTLSLRDIALFVRCNVRFVEDSLTLRIATLTPDSLRCEETLRLGPAPERLPSAVRGEILTPYRLRVRLPRSGSYRWQVAPTRPVAGIEAVGIRIEPSN